MTYRRRILRYGPSPDELQSSLTDRVIAGCQFELHRRGGCGRGDIRLNDRFDDREALQVGEWIACEYDDGERWYLGRIEERRAETPGGVVLRLEGMSVQLGEVYPGGFGVAADGAAPHRYGNSDPFPADPDHHLETVDAADRPEDVVRLLMSQYVVPSTDIRVEAGYIENAAVWTEPVSLKFQGEETVRTIMKDLALRVRNASWGVDELGRFFFLQGRSDTLVSYREGENLIELREEQSRESIYNRVLLTGGYVYSQPTSEAPNRTAVRWRGNYRQPASIERYGERRLRMWVPWIRTSRDSQQFIREFFRVYAEPGRTYSIQAVGQTTCPRPWLGRVQLLDRHDQTLLIGQPETVRVRFDNTPRIVLELGPDDPRTHWPEPPHDERYPQIPPPEGISSGPGGPITLTLPSDGDGPTDPVSSESSITSDDLSSSLLATSDVSSSDVTSSAISSSSSWSSETLSEDSMTDGSGGSAGDVTSSSDDSGTSLLDSSEKSSSEFFGMSSNNFDSSAESALSSVSDLSSQASDEPSSGALDSESLPGESSVGTDGSAGTAETQLSDSTSEESLSNSEPNGGTSDLSGGTVDPSDNPESLNSILSSWWPGTESWSAGG